MANLPALLLPAGSPEALDAALAAGADEVYLGGKSFNARINANNFENDELFDAITKCHFYGVKANATLNISLFDREYGEMLSFVEQLYKHDIDSLIVSDLGVANEIKKRFPDLRLHASTQCAGHNSSAAKLLHSLGFSRMVMARECSFGDIVLTKRAFDKMEYEIFVHGAYCVSHSGMCSLSACMGGRSGNRGECAQPCRLPDNFGKHRLSLKDMCLAEYIPQIIDSGVSALKVEGRMKSPEYVYGVGRIYRALLDEKRPATKEEIDRLSALFSRSGFTDAYFTHKIGAGMLGVRTENDKKRTEDAETTEAFSLKNSRRRLKVKVTAELCRGRASRLQMSCDLVHGTVSAVVYGAPVADAITAPLTKDAIIKNLSKLGNTPFVTDRESISIILDEGVIMPLAALNSLRRTAVDKLLTQITTVSYPKRSMVQSDIADEVKPVKNKEFLGSDSAHFTHAEAIPPRAYLSQFSHIYLPLEQYLAASDDVRSIVNGVEIPSVALEHEYAELEDMLVKARYCGAAHAIVNNIGSLSLALKYNFTVHGGVGLNVFSTHDAQVLSKLGLSDVIMSPELKSSQLAAVSRDCDVQIGAAVYGKLPVMTVEKCVIRDIALGWHSPNIDKCAFCDTHPYTYITDRRGAKLPVRRTFKHRNIIYNSVPVYMADKAQMISCEIVGNRHFFFTDETSGEAAEIIEAYRLGKPYKKEHRRL